MASSKKAEPEDGPQATSSSISQVFSPSYLDSYPLLSMASKAPIEKRHGKQPNLIGGLRIKELSSLSRTPGGESNQTEGGPRKDR